jgi:hypothetical protein
VIGGRRGRFEAELLQAMQPFEQNGFLKEEIVAQAAIFR